MLAITRYAQQFVTIGDIKIVVDCPPGIRVRLLIDAPKEMKIDRHDDDPQNSRRKSHVDAR